MSIRDESEEQQKLLPKFRSGKEQKTRTNSNHKTEGNLIFF